MLSISLYTDGIQFSTPINAGGLYWNHVNTHLCAQVLVLGDALNPQTRQPMTDQMHAIPENQNLGL